MKQSQAELRHTGFFRKWSFEIFTVVVAAGIVCCVKVETQNTETLAARNEAWKRFVASLGPAQPLGEILGGSDENVFLVGQVDRIGEHRVGGLAVTVLGLTQVRAETSQAYFEIPNLRSLFFIFLPRGERVPKIGELFRIENPEVVAELNFSSPLFSQGARLGSGSRGGSGGYSGGGYIVFECGPGPKPKRWTCPSPPSQSANCCVCPGGTYVPQCCRDAFCRDAPACFGPNGACPPTPTPTPKTPTPTPTVTNTPVGLPPPGGKPSEECPKPDGSDEECPRPPPPDSDEQCPHPGRPDEECPRPPSTRG